MEYVGKAGLAPTPGRTGPIFLWRETETIDDIIENSFPLPTANADGSEIKRYDRFSTLLNLLDLKRLAGFKIRFTDDLLDHLEIHDDPQKKFHKIIFVFHHAKF